MKLDNAGMTLIEGVNLDDESATSNGAGKSTLVDALVWCLYGVTTHEPSAEGDDVVNEKRKKNCFVRVCFAIGDMNYIVTRRRAWKKGGKAAQLDVFAQDQHSIGGGSGDMTKGTMRDTQSALVKLIGMSVATFRHSCVFGQGRAYRFSRLTDSEKKAVLDEMLGSEVYARAGLKAAEQLAQTERELDKVQNALQNALESLQDARKRLSRHRERSEAAARLAQKERAGLKTEIATVAAELNKAGRYLDEKAAKTTWQNAVGEERRAIDTFATARRQAKATSDALEVLETRRKAYVDLDENAVCQACEQVIAQEHTAKQLDALDVTIEQQNAADHLASEHLDEYQRACHDKKALVATTEAVYDAARARTAERAKLTYKLDALKEQLRRLDVAVDNTEAITDEKQRILKLKKKLHTLKSVAKLRKAEAHQLKFWQLGFSAKGLRSLMLDSALPFLNAKLEAYTNALTAGNIQVEFQTQRELKGGGTREDFHIVVKNKFGSTNYTMNSIGERAKIDIIVGLALQDMAASRSKVPVNVAFFDEVFDGLDDRGIDRAVQVLSQLKRESAFIISHKPELKTFFSRRITVTKQHGESRLETLLRKPRNCREAGGVRPLARRDF